MSENFVTVAPGQTGLLADNGCILWKGILNTDGYGYTKVKDELIVDYSLALDADLGRCLREGFSARHHCDDISIGLKSGQKKTRSRTSILPVHIIRHQAQASCLSIE